MSEEILKALMQLFAIISKQDEGVTDAERDYVKIFLQLQFSDDLVEEYYSLFEEYCEEKQKGASDEVTKKQLTSVKDSVRTLGICKRINKTLTQEQKAVVLVRLFELINSDRNFSTQRISIIDTVSQVFNIEHSEYVAIELFVKATKTEDLQHPNLLIIANDNTGIDENTKFIASEGLDTKIVILRIPSVNLYFLGYTGKQNVLLNGFIINPKRIYLFASGSTIKPPIGKPIYYSDVATRFLADTATVNLSFLVNKIQYLFPNGKIGLQEMTLTEGSGKLIGIMGASGAGKTTLLNVLSGIEKPSKGEVTINGINIHTQKDEIEGILGFVPQDDLLIEELSVFQNLYYNAKLCFKNLSNEAITELVLKVLDNLGLVQAKDMKVGNPLDKKISGGQRKRLNIGLELIREPSVLFLDEPTSGLSSRDSENVMDLLRELTQKGKLIFVVIHQPSSEIYKMFDKIVFLDTGGYLIYYGNPVEAITYFKKIDHQVNSEIGECYSCGNVNPELTFNIVEARIVDEFGQATANRKIIPSKWNELYHKHHIPVQHEEVKEQPPKALFLPSKIKQFIIFFTRDLLSKLSNRQYLVINMMEAPLLAFFLAFIVRYISNPNSTLYIFRENENLPAYIFMSVIVLLFTGLTVSAEEIYRDKKILKRESFLNLSKSSYLLSKIAILFILSAIQALLFVIIGNSILGIKEMLWAYWLVLFTISCCANLIGLNISASFNSAVTIYILIPLLIIPQLILGGAMFSYEKLNRFIGGGYNVPFIAELIPARWAYEALMVHQFKDNKFEKLVYNVEKDISHFDYKNRYYIPELLDILDKCEKNINNDSIEGSLQLLRNELQKAMNDESSLQYNYINQLTTKTLNQETIDSTRAYLENLNVIYNLKFNTVYFKKELVLDQLNKSPEKEQQFRKFRDDYYNDYLSDLVKQTFTKNKIIQQKGELIQVIDPIFYDPQQGGYLNFKAHFFSPTKHFFGKRWDTFYFNIFIIWSMSLIFFITLYYDVLKKSLNFTGNLK